MGHKKRGSPSSPCVAVDGFQPIKSLASPPSLPKISIKIVEPILGTTATTHHWTRSTGQNNGKLDQFLLSQKNTFQLLSQHKSDFRIIVENVNEQPNIHLKIGNCYLFFHCSRYVWYCPGWRASQYKLFCPENVADLLHLGFIFNFPSDWVENGGNGRGGTLPGKSDEDEKYFLPFGHFHKCLGNLKKCLGILIKNMFEHS